MMSSHAIRIFMVLKKIGFIETTKNDHASASVLLAVLIRVICFASAIKL